MKKEAQKDAVKMGKNGKRDRWGKDLQIRNKGEVRVGRGEVKQGEEEDDAGTGTR